MAKKAVLVPPLFSKRMLSSRPGSADGRADDWFLEAVCPGTRHTAETLNDPISQGPRSTTHAWKQKRPGTLS
jgi:hypothetical protein